MLGAITLCAVTVLASSATRVDDFQVIDNKESVGYFRDWAIQHGRYYSSVHEFNARYSIFQENMKAAAILNAQRENRESAWFGPTKFADLTDKEFEETMLREVQRVEEKETKINIKTVHGDHHEGLLAAPKNMANDIITPAESFDWSTKKGVVTPVRDQGRYPTGWAFAGITTLESRYAIMTGNESVILSPESVIDCANMQEPDRYDYTCGVKGGTPKGCIYWLSFAQDVRGVMAEKDYRYCVADTNTCLPCAPPNYSPRVCNGTWPIQPCEMKDSCKAKYNTSKFIKEFKPEGGFDAQNIPDDYLEAYLLAFGPMAAALDARDLRLYKGGVLKPNLCNPLHLNHHAVIVGYNNATTTPVPYWRLKNSWGVDWGEHGFFRLQKGVDACGINKFVALGFVEL